MESEEARKALDLARKHDLGGNTNGALKWARKSVAIYSTPEATELVARLEVHGASGKASDQSAPEASATSTETAPAAGATKRNAAPASSGASEGKREYTEAQIQVVRRVKRAGGNFYSVLDIEKSADENQVKKSYRKLALQLHPDKNRAPGADEAFKLVSKAFTVLSDKDKRAMYDRFGGDPESRFGGASSSAANAASGFAGTRMRPGFTQEVDPEDLFNMFFGGGMHGMHGGFAQGPTFTFGGPGFRTHYYGGRPGANAFRAQAGANRQAAGTSNNSPFLFQLLPVFILILFSLLSYLSSIFTVSDPDFRWQRTSVHRMQRTTANRGIPYFVEPSSFASHPYVSQANGRMRTGPNTRAAYPQNPEFVAFERRVEEAWMKELYRQCEYAQENRRHRILDAQGFFGIGADHAKIDRISKERYESCEQLDRLFHIRL